MPQEETSTPTGLPEGISKPLAGINAQDQSGLIAILTAFALGLVLLSIGTRIYARHEFRLYRIDDFTFFAATVRITLPYNLDAVLNSAGFCSCSIFADLRGTPARLGKIRR